MAGALKHLTGSEASSSCWFCIMHEDACPSISGESFPQNVSGYMAYCTCSGSMAKFENVAIVAYYHCGGLRIQDT